jgi:drug/metabolite transporter (DMT)-like permease
VRIWKFLHVVTMFAAVSLFVGESVLFERIARSRDVPAIRRFGALAPPVVRTAIALVLLGLVFGLITVNDEHFSYTDTWVVIAYFLYAGLFALGPFEGRFQTRITDAAKASPDDAASPQLEALISNTGRRAIVVISMVLYVAIIYDMVMKPFP